jgi:hypothetical protein
MDREHKRETKDKKKSHKPEYQDYDIPNQYGSLQKTPQMINNSNFSLFPKSGNTIDPYSTPISTSPFNPHYPQINKNNGSMVGKPYGVLDPSMARPSPPINNYQHLQLNAKSQQIPKTSLSELIPQYNMTPLVPTINQGFGSSTPLTNNQISGVTLPTLLSTPIPAAVPISTLIPSRNVSVQSHATTMIPVSVPLVPNIAHHSLSAESLDNPIEGSQDKLLEQSNGVVDDKPKEMVLSEIENPKNEVPASLSKDMHKEIVKRALVHYHITSGRGWYKLAGYQKGTDVAPIIAVRSGSLHSIRFSASSMVKNENYYICKNIGPKEIINESSPKVMGYLKINGDISVNVNFVIDPNHEVNIGNRCKISWISNSLKLERGDRIGLFCRGMTNVDIEIYVEYEY